MKDFLIGATATLTLITLSILAGYLGAQLVMWLEQL